VPSQTAPPITEILRRVREEGRDRLFEPEGYAVARALGFATPRFTVLSDAARLTANQLDSLAAPHVVVKVISPDILHKTDAGGVAVVPHDLQAVRAAVEAMAVRLSRSALAGFLLAEFVPHSVGLGAQLLVGMRFTRDFGTVVTVGLGGVQTEFLSRRFDGGRSAAVYAPGLHDADSVRRTLGGKAVGALATGGVRGTPGYLTEDELVRLVSGLLAFAATDDAAHFEELEINPLALTPAGPVALDVLARLRGDPDGDAPPPRPIGKLRALLQPRTAAVMGVSGGQNPGRTILRNMLRDGFPAERLAVVKPGGGTIDGVRCYPEIAALPAPVDLLVVSVAAAQVPDAVDAVIAGQWAESLIVIPGGLGERHGTEDLERRVRHSLSAARSTAWGGPVVNGGNCLGIRSVPGRYDTMFIPQYKRPAGEAAPSPLAIVAQSGAFAVSRASKLLGLDARYLVSVGNQTDLTVGDYLAYFEADPEVRIVACYVEGFRPLDGRRWLAAAAEIVASGRQVILYRAGRTPAGSRATVSHTAVVAGEYAVVRELAESVGVVVADSLDDFDDLVRLFCYLDGKEVGGMRLGAVSNAGFECVAIADTLGGFTLPDYAASTTARLAEVLRSAGLEGVVAPQNPVDLTPITTDAGYEAATRAVLDDEAIDVAVVGCVPLTPALNTLPAGAGHGEDFTREDGIAQRLRRLQAESPKAWVAVVDAGPLYDPLVAHLLAHGIPTFRSADRALRLFDTYCRRRLAAPSARRRGTDGP
jgi:acyl-CoA synthetase (NDP forming)